MEKFQKIQEAKTPAIKANIEPIINVAKTCSGYVPVRTKTIDSVYDTSGIAEMLLDGAYLLVDNYTSYVITAEDVAKVPGFNDLIKKGSGKIKIGRKGFSFTVASGNFIWNKASKLEVLNGVIIEDIVPNKLDSNVKKVIQNGPVIYAMKAKLSEEYVEGWFSGKNADEKLGCYVTDYKGGIKVLLVSAFDLTKGENFYIYGQQHASKNERFTYVDMNDVRYVQLTKNQLMPPRAYKKGLIQDRANGTFVAK